MSATTSAPCQPVCPPYPKLRQAGEWDQFQAHVPGAAAPEPFSDLEGIAVAAVAGERSSLQSRGAASLSKMIYLTSNILKDY